MLLKGRIINGGKAEGNAFVLDIPFSFIGDFDPTSGNFAVHGHALAGQSMANRIVVCPTGKGGTIAPFIAYQAKLNGKAPAGIICHKADPILCESAMVIGIPIIDGFDVSPVQLIQTGQPVIIDGDTVEIGDV